MHSKECQNSHDLLNPGVKKRPGKLKKALAVLCAAAVIGTAVPVISLSANAQTTIYATTTAYLNLRKGAGMNYGVLKLIPNNSRVTVVDRSTIGWLKVKLDDGTVGYCSSEYLDITNDALSTAYLNVRRGAGTGFSIIKTIAPDTKVDVLKFYGNSWAYVKLPDATLGYVSTDYLSFVENNTSSSSGNTQSKVTISVTSQTLAVGTGIGLKATTTSGGDIIWTSSDKSVATVSSSGSVSAVKEGTAVIKATDSKTNKSASCTVTVIKSQSQTKQDTSSTIKQNNTTTQTQQSTASKVTIKLSETTKTIDIGKTFTIKPTVSPANQTLIYTSSNKTVADVSTSGLVSAKGAGTAKITVTDSNKTASAVMTVTVRNNRTISISRTSAYLYTGDGITINASISDGSEVTWTSSDLNVAAVRNGVVSGLRPGTATITAADSTGKVTAKCTVSVSRLPDSSVDVSRYSTSTTAGKTIYIKGYSYNTYATWGTSDSNIASVHDGFIYCARPGKAAISLTDANGYRSVCVVTVYDADPIRFTYASPNSATLSSTVKLVAITDKNRTKVRFLINDNGQTKTVEATNKTTDENIYKWTAEYKVTNAGTFSYEAQSYCNSKWSSCSDGKGEIFVSSKTDSKATSLDKLRASDEVISFIGEKEGFVSSIEYDELAYNVPTLGHGFVVWEGDKFYNHLSRSEGYALLVKSINESSFTTSVNNLLVNNNVRFNQQQFDALVSFSYNLGAGWTSSSDLRGILLDSYGTVPDDASVVGTVTSTSGLNLRKEATTSSAVVSRLGYQESVTLISTTKYNGVWYKVKTSSGTVGYCSGTYLRLSTGSKVARDLTYVNRNALINTMLSYHHAGGYCYYGLLYRRADELEMFLYGDYATDGRNNKYGFPSPYCISFPY